MIDRLADKLVAPGAHGTQDRSDVGLRADRNKRDIGVACRDLVNDLGDARPVGVEVEKDQIRSAFREERSQRLRIGNFTDKANEIQAPNRSLKLLRRRGIGVVEANMQYVAHG